MGRDSKIEWTRHTWNPWRGCTKVSDGCNFCYAERQSKRNLKVLGEWGPQGTRVMASEGYWREPLKWNREAEKAGERHRVFCASMADVFEGPETCTPEGYAVIEAGRRRLFELIDATPHLDWLLLTKRPENWNRAVREVLLAGHEARYVSKGMEMARSWLHGSFPANVWFGTSVENQAAADKRIPALLEVPAAVRFLSCEPLLEDVVLPINGRICPECDDWFGIPSWSQTAASEKRQCPKCCVDLIDEPKIHWVIAGGESGPHARPMHPDWVRSLRDQCRIAGVSFFFKQGSQTPEWSAFKDFNSFPIDLQVREFPQGVIADFSERSNA